MPWLGPAAPGGCSGSNPLRFWPGPASRTVALTVSPNERLQHLFHPWTSFVVVPLFALANAGVEISSDGLRDAATSPITLGIIAALIVGKFVGITSATWLARRFGRLPLTIPWPSLVGVATVAGIGFTVSLLIADISFEGQDLVDAKLGILGGVGPRRGPVMGRVPGHRPGRGPARVLEGWRRRSSISPIRSIPRSTTCVAHSMHP